jgi:predicted RNA-binding protein
MDTLPDSFKELDLTSRIAAIQNEINQLNTNKKELDIKIRKLNEDIGNAEKVNKMGKVKSSHAEITGELEYWEKLKKETIQKIQEFTRIYKFQPTKQNVENFMNKHANQKRISRFNREIDELKDKLDEEHEHSEIAAINLSISKIEKKITDIKEIQNRLYGKLQAAFKPTLFDTITRLTSLLEAP